MASRSLMTFESKKSRDRRNFCAKQESGVRSLLGANEELRLSKCNDEFADYMLFFTLRGRIPRYDRNTRK